VLTGATATVGRLIVGNGLDVAAVAPPPPPPPPPPQPASAAAVTPAANTWTPRTFYNFFSSNIYLENQASASDTKSFFITAAVPVSICLATASTFCDLG
jgi:hypothetical protein